MFPDFKWSDFRSPLSEIQTHLKSGLFEGRISIGPVGTKAIAIATAWPFEIWTFLSGFQMVFGIWRQFIRISNGGFQITFKICTLCNPTVVESYDHAMQIIACLVLLEEQIPLIKLLLLFNQPTSCVFN